MWELPALATPRKGADVRKCVTGYCQTRGAEILRIATLSPQSELNLKL